MAALSRSDAQRRVDDIRVFREELSRIETEGVLRLEEAQRAALDKHHDTVLAELKTAFDVDRNPAARQLSLGMRIASFIGALALAASVCLLFYNFWGFLSTQAQVVIVIGVALGSLLATAAIARHDATGYFTKLAAMVTFACFVLDISMLGQIFNITPSDKALLPWAALAFLLAYAYELRLLQVAGILCLCAFIAARVGTWSGMYWIYFGERPENFFPAALLILLVPVAFDQSRFAGFAATYRIWGMLALFLPMLVLANWGSTSYLDLDPDLVQGLYQTLAFAGTAGFIWLGTRRDWKEVSNTGVALFVIFLYTKLFDWWWDWMPKYIFFLLMALAAVLLLIVFKRLRGAIA